MKLSQLLSQRPARLRQARLANLAFAFARLADFADRVDRARLTGTAHLRPAAPDAGLPWPTLTLDGGNPAVIEEHFTDEDVIDLSDVLAFLAGRNDSELDFPIEDLGRRFLPPLRRELEECGVIIDDRPTRPRPSTRPRIPHAERRPDSGAGGE